LGGAVATHRQELSVIWNQTYLLFGHGLAFTCVLASLPVLTLVLLLGVLRRPAWIASPCGLVVALLVAVLAYGMPVRLALSAAANGAAFAVFPILWIIFWAIVLFRVTVEAGQFEIIKDSIGRLTPDPRLQALLIAFAFAGFLEGAAGFGTPVAIAATMLVGLGFSAFNASALCLLANTAPVAFGSIGIPIVTLALTTGLSPYRLGAAVGAICTPLAGILPIYLMLAMGGRRAVRGIWVPLLVAGVVFGAGQLLVSTLLGPQLTDILASLATIAALVFVLKLRRPDAEVDMGFRTRAPLSMDGGGPLVEARVPPSHPAGRVAHAWAPYGILVACVLLWGWGPLQSRLNAPTMILKWPGLNDLVMRMPPIVNAPAPYHAAFAFNWLAAPGTACMVATLISAVFLGLKPRRFFGVVWAVVRQLLLPTVTIVSVLAIAFLMNFCGATATLGLAFAATGSLFPFFSALLGWFGVFLTGSDTSANALFGNLQVVTAQRLGFSPVLMAAASSSGGVMGKMISLQTIAIAAAATGLNQAEQSRLFRFVLRHSIALAAMTGVVVLLLVYVFRFSW
jgi:L-lactate transport